MKESVKMKIKNAPESPGVYIFKNSEGDIIYVGKARSLKDRLNSYLSHNIIDDKTSRLIEEIDDFEIIITKTEKDAFFLENNLVRENQPKFNVKLKDDKAYPIIKITVQEDFPGAYYVRRIENDGARYFGPFAPASSARNTMRILSKWFKIRQCSENIDARRERPCLDYYINQCTAPCTGYVSKEEYRRQVMDAIMFLEGRTDELTEELKRRMMEMAERENFERAAELRDLIKVVQSLKEKPVFTSVSLEEQDIIGFSREDGDVFISLFLMREGKVAEKRDFSFKDIIEGNEDFLSSFIVQYYLETRVIPSKIIIPFPIPNKEFLETYIKKETGIETELKFPRSGTLSNLLKIANQNAKLAMKGKKSIVSDREILEILRFKDIPRKIEGFDVSHIYGTEKVGSMVTFIDSKPKKDGYKRFIIKEVEGIDDTACIKEIVRRRYKRVLEEEGSFPDLILVDGGKGQLNSAIKALEELGITNLPVIAIAKEEELLYVKGKDGLRLERTSPFLKLLQRIRDEAHRFAISFHRMRREKLDFKSLLDGIKGVGNRKKEIFYSRFQSLDEIKNAERKEIEAILGKAQTDELIKRVEDL
ncbi:MAG: excinuclease ABC subunit UvrC [Candidatus Aminicenantia bacterium]